MARASQSLGASWLFSSSAARAGDRVRELKAEMTVEKAMVKRELAVEFAGQPADEGDRHEDGAQAPARWR